jgi:hypothetical protein
MAMKEARSMPMMRTTTRTVRLAALVAASASSTPASVQVGGGTSVIHDIIDQRRFPGMQPVGMYPIHIVVKNSRVMLLGVVDSASDRQLAEVRAREVTGVFAVENSLAIVR